MLGSIAQPTHESPLRLKRAAGPSRGSGGCAGPVHKRQRIHAPPSSSDAVYANGWRLGACGLSDQTNSMETMVVTARTAPTRTMATTSGTQPTLSSRPSTSYLDECGTTPLHNGSAVCANGGTPLMLPSATTAGDGKSDGATRQRQMLLASHEWRIPSSPPLPNSCGGSIINNSGPCGGTNAPAAAAVLASHAETTYHATSEGSVIVGGDGNGGMESHCRPPSTSPWWTTASDRLPIADAGTCSYCCQRTAMVGVQCERCDRVLCEMCARGCDRCAMTGCPVCCIVDFDSPVERTLCGGCFDERGLESGNESSMDATDMRW